MQNSQAAPAEPDLLSIGDFARAASLSVSAVRFYADRNVLPPVMTDPATGYRYYAASQIETAAMVRDLRRIDMALPEVVEVISMPATARRHAISAQIERLEAQLDEARTVASELGARWQPTNDTSGAASVRASDLAQAIAQVVPITSIDRRAPHLMCVQVEVSDATVRLAGTDRYRLSIRELVSASAGSDFSMVVAAAELREWPARLASVSMVSLAVEDGDLVARGDEIELRCRPIPAEFPDYQAVLSGVGAGETAVADRDRLLAMLDACEDQATVYVSALDGEISVAVDLESTAAAWAAVNPAFARQAVEHSVSAEIAIEIGDPLEPVAFRSVDDGSYTAMVMPVELQAAAPR